LAWSEPLCSAGQSSRTSGPAQRMGQSPARQGFAAGWTVIAVVLAHLALARALSRRSGRRGDRALVPRCSRRGSDRGRRGRSVRGAHARAGSNGRTATGLHRRGEASRSSPLVAARRRRPLPEPYCCRRRRIRETLRWSHKVGSIPGSSRPGPTRSVGPLHNTGRTPRRRRRDPTRSLIHLAIPRSQLRNTQPGRIPPQSRSIRHGRSGSTWSRRSCWSCSSSPC
jgi:hypothetical protein